MSSSCAKTSWASLRSLAACASDQGEASGGVAAGCLTGALLSALPAVAVCCAACSSCCSGVGLLTRSGSQKITTSASTNSPPSAGNTQGAGPEGGLDSSEGVCFVGCATSNGVGCTCSLWVDMQLPGPCSVQDRREN